MADGGGRCRICSLELRGSQRRWIFGGESATGRPGLRVILSHLLGQELVRGDGRGEFACGKCAFSLERVYRYDGVMNRVKALSIERMQKLATERDKLAQCVLFQYGRSNPGQGRPGGGRQRLLDASRVAYNDLLQDDAAFSEYESWSERGGGGDGSGGACSYSFASTPLKSAPGGRGPSRHGPASGRSTPSGCGGAAAMRRSVSVDSLRVPDARYESVCKVPRKVAAGMGARSPWSVSRSVSVGGGSVGTADGASSATRRNRGAGQGSFGRRGWGAVGSVGSSVSLGSLASFGAVPALSIAEEEEDGDCEDAVDSVSVFSARSPVTSPPPPALARSLQLVRSIGVRSLRPSKGSRIPTPARRGGGGGGSGAGSARTRSERSTPRGSPRREEAPELSGGNAVGAEERGACREDVGQQLERNESGAAARIGDLERSLACAVAGPSLRERLLEDCARMAEERAAGDEDSGHLVTRLKDRLSEGRSAPVTSEARDGPSDPPRARGTDGRDERAGREERDGRDEKELLCLREALEEKDSDIRRLCSVLSSNESTIASLDTVLKQKDEELKRSSDAFLEMIDGLRSSHARAARQKDALIAEMEQALRRKLRDTEELLRSRSSGGDEALAEATERCVEQQRQLQQALVDRTRELSEHQEEVERTLRLVVDKERLLKERMEASSTAEGELRAEIERLKRSAVQSPRGAGAGDAARAVSGDAEASERPHQGGRDGGGVDATLVAENVALKAQLAQQEKLLKELMAEGSRNGDHGRYDYDDDAHHLLLLDDDVDDDEGDDDLLPEFPRFVTRSPPLGSAPGERSDADTSRPPAAAFSNGLEAKKAAGSDGGRQQSPPTAVSTSASAATLTKQPKQPAKQRPSKATKQGPPKKRAAMAAGGGASSHNGKKAAAPRQDE
uniref:Uncharacterized protein LOC116953151 n=1 Tax=Petromyzon marinus TaxID=7757 RepID=A0AAJ7U5B6_PETMA|nr:uncharacterized protein LOC116953151 [Petromyzon marinus]XP_032828946.1 uncharacterized protein LOC116953151 [Petromyzon marinus]XP_032828947.1 uncharacterized protein LOC116953151 [Petromyzon marinus]XP_032828948.1 uncharacterized protein LOC116953151 [Petromyzon marinus]